MRPCLWVCFPETRQRFKNTGHKVRDQGHLAFETFLSVVSAVSMTKRRNLGTFASRSPYDPLKIAESLRINDTTLTQPTRDLSSHAAMAEPHKHLEGHESESPTSHQQNLGRHRMFPAAHCAPDTEWFRCVFSALASSSHFFGVCFATKIWILWVKSSRPCFPYSVLSLVHLCAHASVYGFVGFPSFSARRWSSDPEVEISPSDLDIISTRPLYLAVMRQSTAAFGRIPSFST